METNITESEASTQITPEISPEKSRSPDYRKSRITQPENVFLILLIATDIFFIIFHLLSAYHLLPKYLGFGNKLIPTGKEMFSLSRDRGFPEIFQYIQYVWIFILLILASYRNNNWRYLAWSPLFLYLLADDYGRFHENIGARLAVQFNLPSILGLHPKHTGELIVAVVMGMSVLIILGYALLGGNRQFKKFSRIMVILMVAFAVCSVGIDAINNMIGDATKMNILGILEDGGEMVVVSVMSWWTFNYATKYFG